MGILSCKYYSSSTRMLLRGLVVQMEPLGERETYSPLRWVLKIMFDLFERTGDYKINYIEFAVCVQTSSPKYELKQL